MAFPLDPKAGFSSLVNTAAQAGTRLDLTPAQQARVSQAEGTLRKLAGDDDRWTPSDLADNLQALQFQGVIQRRLGPIVAEKKLSAGFEQMTGKPQAPLTDEMRQAAKERWEALTPQQRSARTITRDQLERFQSTMDMIQQKAAEKKLPEGKFPNGLPVQFLKHVQENQPAAILKLDSLY